jgi:uncharacterized membrane protein
MKLVAHRIIDGIERGFKWIARAYSDRDGTPSSNRIHMGVITFSVCFFIVCLGIDLVETHKIADAGMYTSAILIGMAGFAGAIRGVQTFLQNKNQPPQSDQHTS